MEESPRHTPALLDVGCSMLDVGCSAFKMLIAHPPNPVKKFLLVPALLATLVAGALAEAPQPFTDFHKTLRSASKDQKLAFVLLGRPTCSICNATKAMIKEGKIDVTSADYVMGDLNVDDQRTYADFVQKYGKENFGDTLPFVVVTDSHRIPPFCATNLGASVSIVPAFPRSPFFRSRFF